MGPKKTRKKKNTKDPNAQAMGRKGGAARAKALTADERSAIARKGGISSRQSLSAEERSAIAKKGGHARWEKKTE